MDMEIIKPSAGFFRIPVPDSPVRVRGETAHVDIFYPPQLSAPDQPGQGPVFRPETDHLHDHKGNVCVRCVRHQPPGRLCIQGQGFHTSQDPAGQSPPDHLLMGIGGGCR